MRHGLQQNTRVALIMAAMFCAAFSAAAQRSLQQALLRSSSQALAPGDDAAVAPSTSVASALQDLAAQAAIIFTGSVVTVTADTNGGARVTFQVEQGVRGVASGAGYNMHVSAWGGGVERYVPGERALFLLTGPSVSGYSAPIMGERGVVPLSGDALVGNLDLRWIAADVQHGAPAQEGISAANPLRAAAALPGANGAGVGSQQDAPASAATATPDVHAIDRDLILDLLRSGNSAAAQAR